MKNYDVNEANGAVDYASKHSLVYMKLYPYSLFGLAFLGLLTTVVWELSAAKRAGQTSYIIDGIEEAMGELISALKGYKTFNFSKCKIFKHTRKYYF